MSLICLCYQKGRQCTLLVAVDSLYLEFKRDQRISSRWRKDCKKLKFMSSGIWSIEKA